jgi:undecaprenyl-diphosphatase
VNKKTKKYLLVVLIISFLIITGAVISHNSFVARLDNSIAVFVSQISSPTLDSFALSITKFGNSTATIFIFVILAIFLYFSRKKYQLYALTIAVVSGTILAEIIKFIVQRVRPVSHLLLETDFSFPSGHATMSTILLLSSFILIAPNIENRYLRIIFLIIVSIIFPLIALSRIYLSVHWASDVLASLILGSVCFLLSEIIVSKYKHIA